MIITGPPAVLAPSNACPHLFQALHIAHKPALHVPPDKITSYEARTGI